MGGDIEYEFACHGSRGCGGECLLLAFDASGVGPFDGLQLGSAPEVIWPVQGGQVESWMGFDEEQEWRVVYMRERDPNKVFDPMLSYMTSTRGIEKKLKFKIEHHPGATAEDLSLSKVVDRIILGPTVSSPIAAAAFRRMLAEHGEPDLIPRVFASTIPYRHKG